MHDHTVILGPGLLGGSLALALAARGAQPMVWGRRRAPLDYLSKASGGKLRTEVDLGAAAREASLIVLCTPIGIMPDLIERLMVAKALRPDVIITDVGSVKGPIVEHAAGLLKGTSARFVGSHPMAGSECSGVEASRPDLYEGAMCLITPTAGTDPDAVDGVQDFWVTLGMRVFEMAPFQHDRVVASISHMPHVLAAIVVAAALRRDPSLADFAAGGLRDTTRVASGDPMWAEILLENRQAVLETLHHAQTLLQDVIGRVEAAQIEPLQRFLLEAKTLRDTHIVPRG